MSNFTYKNLFFAYFYNFIVGLDYLKLWNCYLVSIFSLFYNFLINNISFTYFTIFLLFLLAFSFNQGFSQHMMFLHTVLFLMSFSLTSIFPISSLHQLPHILLCYIQKSSFWPFSLIRGCHSI